MDSGVSMLRILFLLDVGGAQVLATGKPPAPEIDFKYALIGTAVGVAISAGFLALKIYMIRRHLFDDDSSDLRSPPGGLSDTYPLKKRAPRRNHNFSKRFGWVFASQCCFGVSEWTKSASGGLVHRKGQEDLRTLIE
uniref:transmembrane protein 273 isoform X2 n=1 Tax=Callithrix jacchus TaxID=9483 RepID=UPI00159CFDE3|nr:transmembrane protein 273 isoform X2 [Callithrix jacchus]